MFSVELEPWGTPNFVRTKLGGDSIKIEDLEAETLSALCDEFRKTMFERAGWLDPRVIKSVNDDIPF